MIACLIISVNICQFITLRMLGSMVEKVCKVVRYKHTNSPYKRVYNILCVMCLPLPIVVPRILSLRMRKISILRNFMLSFSNSTLDHSELEGEPVSFHGLTCLSHI